MDIHLDPVTFPDGERLLGMLASVFEDADGVEHGEVIARILGTDRHTATTFGLAVLQGVSDDSENQTEAMVGALCLGLAMGERLGWARGFEQGPCAS